MSRAQKIIKLSSFPVEKSMVLYHKSYHLPCICSCNVFRKKLIDYYQNRQQGQPKLSAKSSSDLTKSFVKVEVTTLLYMQERNSNFNPQTYMG